MGIWKIWEYENDHNKIGPCGMIKVFLNWIEIELKVLIPYCNFFFTIVISIMINVNYFLNFDLNV